MKQGRQELKYYVLTTYRIWVALPETAEKLSSMTRTGVGTSVCDLDLSLSLPVVSRTESTLVRENPSVKMQLLFP